MKKSFPLLLLVCSITPVFGQAADAANPSDAVAGMLMLVGQMLLLIVGVLLALAWIWFPFMVKGRLDNIIRKLDNIEQIQAKLCAAPPLSR